MWSYHIATWGDPRCDRAGEGGEDIRDVDRWGSQLLGITQHRTLTSMLPTPSFYCLWIFSLKCCDKSVDININLPRPARTEGGSKVDNTKSLSCMQMNIEMVVSASNIMPTDHWLNIWWIRHTKWETHREFQSSHLIGWLLQDFRKACVSRSLTIWL